MVSTIVQTSSFVTLLGAGDATIAQIRTALELAPILIAADGGANTALQLGVAPEAVIGDLDSVTDDVARQIPSDRMHHIAEQNSTDFDKTLRSIDAPMAIAVGFTGARLDHTLAAFNVLVRYPDKKCLLLGQHDVVAVLPPRIAFSLHAGTRVSLFPMSSVGVSSTGLKWPTDGIDFAPDGATGTSNEALGGRIELLTSAPVMLLALPASEIVCLLNALSLSPTWIE